LPLGGKSDLDNTVIYVNPRSGSGRALAAWRRLERRQPRLAAARLVLAESAAEARAELDHRLAAGAQRVIAIGGDGTAQLVASCLLSSGLGQRVALGLVPAGTGSDLARCLGLPRQPLAALRQALQTTPRAFDAIRLRTEDGATRFAVNIASVGVSGAIGQAVNRLERRGQATYLLTTLRTLASYRPERCRVEIDGELFCDGLFWCVAVANGRYFGKGMQVAPRAEVDDGLLDVVLIPPIPGWQLPWRLVQLYRGTHLALDGVLAGRGREVRITPAASLPPFDLDGESHPSAAATFDILPGALRLLA